MTVELTHGHLDENMKMYKVRGGGKKGGYQIFCYMSGFLCARQDLGGQYLPCFYKRVLFIIKLQRREQLREAPNSPKSRNSQDVGGSAWYWIASQ